MGGSLPVLLPLLSPLLMVLGHEGWGVVKSTLELESEDPESILVLSLT